MPTVRLSMRKLREVLRLKFEGGLSHAQIGRACGISKGAVSKYIQRAQGAGLSWPLPEGLDEAELERLLYPATASSWRPCQHALPEFAAIHQALKRKGVTLRLLWQEYGQDHPQDGYSYAQFCLLYRNWRGQQKRSMRQVHKAGEKLFVDYCGPSVAVIDGRTGQSRPAQIFVAVPGASNYTYAEATWTQSLPDWIGSHDRALRYFQGVPALIIPDNLRAGVAKACRYDPDLNPTYGARAEYYGTAVLPARPYKPKDKAKVEVAVQVVERWILARLRQRQFFALGELNQAIAQLLEDLNQRPFQKLPGNRYELFVQLDRPALKPLPPTPYEYAEWQKVKPGIDYHIEVKPHFYSVPHTLAGKVLEVCSTADTVEVLYRGNRVASHRRSTRPGFTTIAAHMPEPHRHQQAWSPERFLNWARSIGPQTAQFVQHLLDDRPHPEQAYRVCLGLLNQAKRYGKTRLEGACERALAIGSKRLKSIRSILQQGLDRLPPESEQTPSQSTPTSEQSTLPTHENLRGSRYYH